MTILTGPCCVFFEVGHLLILNISLLRRLSVKVNDESLVKSDTAGWNTDVTDDRTNFASSAEGCTAIQTVWMVA